MVPGRRQDLAPSLGFWHRGSMNRFGWVPDSEEGKKKDWKAAPLLAKIAPKTRLASYSLRRFVLSILNQGDLGSCVLNAKNQALRMVQVKAGDRNPELSSRLFGYYYSRALSPGDTRVDSGTQIRCAFDVTRKIGDCPERIWPYDISKFARMPNMASMQAAFDQKTSVGYYRIDSTGSQRVEDVCNALAADCPVVFGTVVGQNFLEYHSGSPSLTRPSSGVGRHALLIVGFQPNSKGSIDLDVCNSWGDGWGNQGYCFMDESYLTWSETQDIWVVQNTPEFTA
jgi:C1A family cysteine protease